MSWFKKDREITMEEMMEALSEGMEMRNSSQQDGIIWPLFFAIVGVGSVVIFLIASLT